MDKKQNQTTEQPTAEAENRAALQRRASDQQVDGEARNIDPRPQYDSFMRVIRR